MEASEIIALVGALGVGSLGTAVFSQAKDRRAARAAVVGALHETERCRWARSTKGFDEAARELAAAALIARVPRRGISDYLALARTAAWASRADWDESGGHDEFAGGITPAHNEAVMSAFSIAIELVWRPWLGQVVAARRRRFLAAEIASLPESLRASLERARRGV